MTWGLSKIMLLRCGSSVKYCGQTRCLIGVAIAQLNILKKPRSQHEPTFDLPLHFHNTMILLCTAMLERWRQVYRLKIIFELRLSFLSSSFFFSFWQLVRFTGNTLKRIR